MTAIKQLWVLAGGNGVGKTTFYQTRLAPLGLPLVNADVIAKELYPDAPEEYSYTAAQIAEQMRNRLVLEGRSFCFETVFSHPSKIDFVARAKALDYQIILIFIHLESAGLNKARVWQRVEKGGHNVPDEKVETRIVRLFDNIKITIPLCDHVRLLDNSSAVDPFQVLVTIRGGSVQHHRSPLPDWAQALL